MNRDACHELSPREIAPPYRAREEKLNARDVRERDWRRRTYLSTSVRRRGSGLAKRTAASGVALARVSRAGTQNHRGAGGTGVGWREGREGEKAGEGSAFLSAQVGLVWGLESGPT